MLDMKVKVVFVKDRITSAQSEQTVDVGDGWDLFASIPLPAGSARNHAQPESGKFGDRVNNPARDLETKVALVFVAEEDDEVIRLEPPRAAPEEDAAQSVRVLKDVVASPRRLRPPPPPPPADPSERSAQSS